MPDHFDFLRDGLTLHALTCEWALVADNFARWGGVSIADSITLTTNLLERFKCSLS